MYTVTTSRYHKASKQDSIISVAYCGNIYQALEKFQISGFYSMQAQTSNILTHDNTVKIVRSDNKLTIEDDYAIKTIEIKSC